MTALEAEFWKKKSLAQLSREEWEALCDGCARCCLHKVWDEETDATQFTCVACKLLDPIECRCRSYRHRSRQVADCLVLRPETVKSTEGLPESCAYRRLAEGRDLEWWHPLVSGDPDTVHRAGISVRGRVLPEANVHPDEWDQFIIDWVR